MSVCLEILVKGYEVVRVFFFFFFLLEVFERGVLVCVAAIRVPVDVLS